MRFMKMMLASVAALVTPVVVAAAAPLALLQDPNPKIDVNVKTDGGGTVWYADPVWLAIGGIVVLLVIVLAIMAGRRGGGDTTVVR